MLASKSDWGQLYLPTVLQKNRVPAAAATYVEVSQLLVDQ
jgi:hypothetical protein